MKRRQQGEGSVTRRKDGRWQVAVDVGWRNGKRRRQYFYGLTPDEALEKRDLFNHRRREGFTPLPGRTPMVSDWCLYWLHTIVKDEVQASTWEKSYRAKVTQHIAPFFARVRLSSEDMDEAQVRAFKRELARKGLAGTTAQHCYRLLSQALKAAVVEGKLLRNPCQNVPAPARSTPEVMPPDEDEVRAILRACESGWRMGPRWVLGMATGLRQGEVLGLLWPHVDLEQGTLAVEWELARLPWRHGCDQKNSQRTASPASVIIRETTVARAAMTPEMSMSRHSGARSSQRISTTYPCGRLAQSCPLKHGGGLRLKRPKTPKSRATVPLAPYAVAALRRWKAVQAAERLACPGWDGWACECGDTPGRCRQSAGRVTPRATLPIGGTRTPLPSSEEGVQPASPWPRYRRGDVCLTCGRPTRPGLLVFTQPDGHPINSRADWGDFQDLCAAAGIPPYRVHDLRHGLATVLLEAGMDIKVVSELLRHSSPDFTRRTYQHVRPKLRNAAAEVIERALGGDTLRP